LKTPIGVCELHDIAQQSRVRIQRCLGKCPGGQITRTGKTSNIHLYNPIRCEINRFEGDPMAFKPNYGRDRAERERAARARSQEKQRKKDEKAALGKAEHPAR
jgi:uncharacterized Fe-S center protein